MSAKFDEQQALDRLVEAMYYAGRRALRDMPIEQMEALRAYVVDDGALRDLIDDELDHRRDERRIQGVAA